MGLNRPPVQCVMKDEPAKKHGLSGAVERAAVQEGCGLDAAGFVAAITPLLEWGLIELKGDGVEARGHGVNYALVGMALEGLKHKSDIRG